MLRQAARAQARTRVIAFSPQGETKYFDTSFSQAIAASADWSGTEVPCTNYIQSDGTTVGAYTDSALIPSAVGAGYGQVVGSKYHLKKIRVRGELIPTTQSDQADMPPPSCVRLCLVHDTRPNGAQAQGEEVFTDVGSAGQVNHSFLAMGAGQAGRFRILADETCELNAVVSGTDGASTTSVVRSGKVFQFSYNFKKPLQVLLKANSATPTVASLSSTNIFLLAHSSTSSMNVIGVARCYYEG